MKHSLRTVLGLVTCYLTLVSSQAIASDTVSPKFVTLADIHFDPFVTCHVAMKSCDLITQLQKSDVAQWDAIFAADPNQTTIQYYHDTTYPLLQSMLAEVSRVNKQEHLQFALVLGDFLGHELRAKYILATHDYSKKGYQRFVLSIERYLALKLRSALPNIDIYPVIGNNDSYTGDYSVIPQGQFLKDLANVWAPLIENKDNQKSFLNTFPNAGYYAVTVPGHSKQRILIINSVLFVEQARSKAVKQAALSELQWLHTQLADVSEQQGKVLFALHIPIGVNVFESLKNVLGGVKEFWLDSYSVVFRNEIKTYAPVIAGILPAHIHMDGFQLFVFNQPKEVPVSFSPSISPIFGNNPGFKVFSYRDQDFKLTNFDVYYFPINLKNKQIWQKEYNFNQVYRSDCLNCDLGRKMHYLTAYNQFEQAYTQYYSLGKAAQPIAKIDKWPSYKCNIYSISGDEYKRCLSGFS